MSATSSRIDNNSVKVVCTTGTETPTAVTEGLDLSGRDYGHACATVDVICVAASGNLTAVAAGLKCYVWDYIVAAWTRCPDLDLTTQVLAAMAFPGMPVSPTGRVIWVPSGLVACTVYLNGTRVR